MSKFSHFEFVNFYLLILSFYAIDLETILICHRFAGSCFWVQSHTPHRGLHCKCLWRNSLGANLDRDHLDTWSSTSLHWKQLLEKDTKEWWPVHYLFPLNAMFSSDTDCNNLFLGKIISLSDLRDHTSFHSQLRSETSARPCNVSR